MMLTIRIHIYRRSTPAWKIARLADTRRTAFSPRHVGIRIVLWQWAFEVYKL